MNKKSFFTSHFSVTAFSVFVILLIVTEYQVRGQRGSIMATGLSEPLKNITQTLI